MSLLPGQRSRWAALGAIAAALTMGGIAYASIPDSGGVIHGCYNPNAAKSAGGAPLKIIDNTSASCNNGEQAITWNQGGPTGPKGPTGAPGSIGTTGPTGATGPSGASHAYVASDHQFIDAHDETQALVTLSGLPAGNYLAWVTIFNFVNPNTPDNTDSLDCGLQDGSGTSHGYDILTPYIDTRSEAVEVGGLPANGKLVLLCGSDAPSGDRIGYATITALRVNSVN